MSYKLDKHGLYHLKSEYKGGYVFRWRDVLRWAGHIPAGAVAGFLIIWVNAQLGALAGLAFLVYEAMEDWSVGDRSFKDVYGVFLGVVGVGLVYFIWFR